MVQLSPDPDFHFEILRDLSAASYSGGDIAEVLTAANRIVPGNFGSYSNAFNILANQVYATANAIDILKNPSAASDAFFRASTYFRSADFFLHGNASDPRIYSFWAQQIDAFDSAIALLPVPGKRVTIGAENFSIPTIYFKAAGPTTPRPTVIIGGGYDGGQEETYHQMGIAALARGWNVILYEGPGQASPRRYQNLGFILEYEKVVTPIVDHLFTLPEVDTSAIALVGLSFGGLLAPRVSAFEPRLVATLALDGLHKFGPLFLEAFPPPLAAIFKTGNATNFDNAVNAARLNAAASNNGTQFRWFVDQGTWAFDTASPFDWMMQLQRYTLDTDGVIDKIPGPIFVADSATDTFFTGQGALLASKLGNKSTYYEFDVASGVGHAGVGGYHMQNQVAYDWLQTILDGV
jgi:pimeloyl-ACP methyl ester carboxylesterase